MWDFFNKPYPFNDDLKRNLKIIAGLTIGVFLFLVLFDPFKVEMPDFNKKIHILLGFSLVTMVLLGILLVLLPMIFPRVFLAGKWTVKSEIILNTCFLIFHSAGYFGFAELAELADPRVFILSRILVVSAVIVVILFAISQDRVLRMHLRNAMTIIKNLGSAQPVPAAETIFTFPSETKSDQLTLSLESLLYIRSADNYVEVVWHQGEEIKKKLIRRTLRETEEALKEFPFIIKCHRSCLVNVKNMRKMKETSHGMLVVEYGGNEEIPVSRQYMKKIRSLLKIS